MVAGIVAAVALVLTAVLTPLVRGAAMGAGLVRQATGDRWHQRPTPAIGGVAIYVGFGVALGVGYLLAPAAVDPLGTRAANALLPGSPRDGLLAAGTLIFLVGLVDDLVALKPLQKLAGQVAAAAVLVLAGIGVWATGSYVADVTLSILWFVAIANAVNLLDNMDGLAAGTAAIAAGYLSLLFFLEGQTGLLLLSLALGGPCSDSSRTTILPPASSWATRARSSSASFSRVSRSPLGRGSRGVCSPWSRCRP